MLILEVVPPLSAVLQNKMFHRYSSRHPYDSSIHRAMSYMSFSPCFLNSIGGSHSLSHASPFSVKRSLLQMQKVGATGTLNASSVNAP